MAQHPIPRCLRAGFGGESTVLFTTAAQLTRAQLLEAAKALGTHDLSVARRIVHLREIPLLASGKVDYTGLKSLIEGEAVRKLLAAMARNPVDTESRSSAK